MIWTKNSVIEYISKWNENDIYECIKKQKKSVRTLAQNSYYWWVIIPIISEHHWYFQVETHVLIKSIFKLKTTTWLNTSEFKWFINQIREIWETKYWVIIPKPEDKNLLNWIDENY